MIIKVGDLSYVLPSEIWPGAKDYVDEGPKDSLVRGYNVEVRKADGTTGWDSCEYISGNIEEELNSEFKQWWYAERNVTPTGRLCFRGYGIHTYDDCVIPCDAKGNYK